MVTSPASSGFLAMAVKLGLLEAGRAEAIARQAAAREIDAERLIRQQGLLTPVQIDIVDTLLRPRDVAPGYEVLAVLGQGGMGVVYRARQLALQRIVALKTIQLTQLGDPKAVARFEQEAQAVARLQHPHIVSAYDFGRHEGRVFFAMELVAGENASNFVATRGPLSEYLAWQLGRQAAAGLAHAAAVGIVHRDVKPANMLLVERPDGYLLPPGVPLLKLADFGLAQLGPDLEVNPRLTTTGTAVGSPHYMSPEQLSGERVDLRSDIYSLGASLFQFLAGAPPFDGATLPKLISAKLAAGAPSLAEIRSDVSPASAALIAAMMARDPALRPASYAELLARIDALGLLPGPLDATAPLRVATVATPPTATDAGLDPTVVLPDHSTAPRPTASPAENRPAASEIPPSPLSTSSGGLSGWTIGAAIGLLLAVAGLAAWFARPAGPVGPRSLEPMGPLTILFSGRGMEGWPAPTSGSWDAARDDEGASVLAGTNGAQRRSLPDEAHYRLSAVVGLRDAQAAEIHFGLPRSPDVPYCGVLRLTPDADELFLCDQHNSRRPVARRSRQAADVGPRATHIERQAADWWVFVDNRLVGTIPLADIGDRAALQLQADGGTVHFADLSVQRLAPPRP